MRITKSLEWMRPYLEDAMKVVPEIRLLTAIVARTPKVNGREVQRAHAMITSYHSGTYHITSFIKKQAVVTYHPKVKLKLLPYSKKDLLEYLAHEIAHLRYWDHSTHHAILTAELTIRFMKRLSKSGYISEEAELKGLSDNFDLVKK